MRRVSLDMKGAHALLKESGFGVTNTSDSVHLQLTLS
eukprot:IDg2046t1